MIIAIEHRRHPAYGDITELHCSNRIVRAVGEAIRRLTGEHPVPIPLCGCTTVYFVRGLDVEEGCALLRLSVRNNFQAEEIDRELIAIEIRRARQERRWFGPEAWKEESDEEVCADCRRLR